MKNQTACIVFLIIGITQTLSAQFLLNFSAGLNSSNVEFENVEGFPTSTKLDYFIGVGPSFRLTDKVRFQVDAQYSLKGYEEAQASPFSVRFAYLDLIPEIEYEVLDFFTFSLGVNYGIRLNQQFKSANNDWSEIPVEIVKPTDFGLTGALKLKYNKLFGFVRYNVGLQNITELSFTNANGDLVEEAKQMNLNLQIGLGYELGFNKN